MQSLGDTTELRAKQARARAALARIGFTVPDADPGVLPPKSSQWCGLHRVFGLEGPRNGPPVRPGSTPFVCGSLSHHPDAWFYANRWPLKLVGWPDDEIEAWDHRQLGSPMLQVPTDLIENPTHYEAAFPKQEERLLRQSGLPLTRTVLLGEVPLAVATTSDVRRQFKKRVYNALACLDRVVIAGLQMTWFVADPSLVSAGAKHDLTPYVWEMPAYLAAWALHLVLGSDAIVGGQGAGEWSRPAHTSKRSFKGMGRDATAVVRMAEPKVRERCQVESGRWSTPLLVEVEWKEEIDQGRAVYRARATEVVGELFDRHPDGVSFDRVCHTVADALDWVGPEVGAWQSDKFNVYAAAREALARHRATVDSEGMYRRPRNLDKRGDQSE